MTVRRRLIAGLFALTSLIPTAAGAAEEPADDTPARDPAPASSIETAQATDATDADDLGLYALVALAALIALALAARARGYGTSDVCPRCSATLSFSGHVTRCSRCDFRVVHARPSGYLFGRAASVPPGEPGPAPSGGAHGSW